MKNKILITFSVILWLFLINIFSINSFYNNFEWKKLYENKDFSGSLNYFKKNKDYIWLYDLWNVNYKLWEKSLPLQEGDLEGVIKLWEKSLDFYKNSMKIKYTKEAEENYDFVKKKLEELKKKQEDQKKNKEQKKQDNNKQENKQNKYWKKWENKQEEKKWNSWEKKDWKTAGQQGGFSPLQKLSPQAKQQIKAYEEKLKQEQKRNVNNFGKVYQEQSNPFDEFDEFFNNSLFDNSILDKGEKRDW